MRKYLWVGLALCFVVGQAYAFDLFGSLKKMVPGEDSSDNAGAASSKSADAVATIDLSGVDISVLKAKPLSFIDKAERIAVPTYRLGIVTRSGRRAVSGGGIKTTVEASADLVGVTDEEVRAIADRALADFIEQLKATGRSVVPMSEIQAASGYAKIEPTPVPFIKKPFGDARTIYMTSPNGFPLISTHADSPVSDQSPLSLGNWRAINQLSVDLNAVILIPTVIIDFAEFKGSGYSVISSSASVTAKPGLYVVDQLSGLSGYHAKIALAGDLGRAILQKRIAIGAAGDFVETSRTSNQDEVRQWNLLANNLPNNAGRPTSSYDIAAYAYRVEPSQFDKTVMDGVVAINRAYAQVAAQYKP